MSKEAKPPARPPVSKKQRRRARRNPIQRWKLGLHAGFDYELAVSTWRGRRASQALIDHAGGAGPKARVVKRIGWRIYGALPNGEEADKIHRKRRRRRNAVLAQEARRRGVFPVKARNFNPFGI